MSLYTVYNYYKINTKNIYSSSLYKTTYLMHMYCLQKKKSQTSASMKPKFISRCMNNSQLNKMKEQSPHCCPTGLYTTSYSGGNIE